VNDADLLRRLARLEAEQAVRRVMTRYMRLCDQPDAGFPIAELGALFTTDAIWEGGGSTYGVAFGQHEGRGAIMEFIESFRHPKSHFTLNVHFLTSEDIVPNGDMAEGSWIMLQLSTYADGHSSVLSARITARFAIEDDAWRIAHFRTENLFNAPWRRDLDDQTAFLAPAEAMTR
jgi:SnoaL-like domain